MNYLAEGLQQGWQTGAQAVQEKKRLKQQAEMAEAQRQLEMDLAAAREAGASNRQQAQIVADAQKQFNQQDWQSGEADKERGWKTGERQGSETYQSGEKEADRNLSREERDADASLRRELQDRDLNQRAQESAGHLAMQGADYGLKARMLDWEQSPQNPLNQYRSSAASRFADDGMGGGFGGGLSMGPQGVNGAPPSPQQRPVQPAQPPQPSAAPVTITTQDQFNRLPRGTRFIFNGKVGVKN